MKQKLTPTRYMCSNALTELGLNTEVERMFHMLGILEFMLFEVPTFARITLEFLSTLQFQLKKKWTGAAYYFYGTMSFRLFNADHEMTVE